VRDTDGVTRYRDRWIECTDDEVRIRGYYFPSGGMKRIPYERIRAVRRVSLGVLTGRGRLWGTANPRYWASLDLGRPGKRVGLILDTGHAVRPFITPDDPESVEAVIRERAGVTAPAGLERGPVI
jgi:hypothetical protein